MAKLQQVLQLYLENSALDSRSVAWAFHDPTDGAGPGVPDLDPSGPRSHVPYKTGLDALRDGWHLLQMTQLIPRAEGTEHSASFLSYEFVFERVVDTAA